MCADGTEGRLSTGSGAAIPQCWSIGARVPNLSDLEWTDPFQYKVIADGMILCKVIVGLVLRKYMKDIVQMTV